MLVDYVSMFGLMFVSNKLLKLPMSQMTNPSTAVSNCYAISAEAF